MWRNKLFQLRVCYWIFSLFTKIFQAGFVGFISAVLDQGPLGPWFFTLMFWHFIISFVIYAPIDIWLSTLIRKEIENVKLRT